MKNMKILGIVDLIAALMLVAVAYRMEIPRNLLIAIVIILIIKALIFLISIGGLIDMAAAVLLILASFFTLPATALLIAAILIGQKGLFSMLAME